MLLGEDILGEHNVQNASTGIASDADRGHIMGRRRRIHSKKQHVELFPKFPKYLFLAIVIE